MWSNQWGHRNGVHWIASAALLVLGVLGCQTDEQGTPQSICGNGVCEVGEGPVACPLDCGGGSVAPAAKCGDAVCNGSETCANCVIDCGSCPATCGDGSCGSNENCSNCEADCGKCAPVCGDGSCNGSETCSSCQQDCGKCAPTCSDACKSDVCASGNAIQKCTLGSNGCYALGSVIPCGGGEVCQDYSSIGFASECGPCGDNDECSSKEVCASGSCTNASGLTYIVTLVSGEVPAVDDNGLNWDPGGLPELKACLKINDKEVGCTSYDQGSVVAAWNKSFETKIYASDVVTVSYWDVDAISNDYIAGIQWSDTVGLVKASGFSGEWSFKPGYFLTMTIVPK